MSDQDEADRRHWRYGHLARRVAWKAYEGGRLYRWVS